MIEELILGIKIKENVKCRNHPSLTKLLIRKQMY